jgi:tetratricopeptide (TPR) repeat protein
MSACGGSSGLSEAKIAYKDGLDASGQGLITEAISHYDKAIQLDPDTAVYYRNRGVAYNKLGQYENAITSYTMAIQIDPDYALAYFNRGVVLRILVKHGLADEDFKKACELDRSHC